MSTSTSVTVVRVDDPTRKVRGCRRSSPKAVHGVPPEPAAAEHQATVAVIRVLAERIVDVARPERADLEDVTDAVDAPLDRSAQAVR